MREWARQPPPCSISGECSEIRRIRRIRRRVPNRRPRLGHPQKTGPRSLPEEAHLREFLLNSRHPDPRRARKWARQASPRPRFRTDLADPVDPVTSSKPAPSPETSSENRPCHWRSPEGIPRGPCHWRSPEGVPGGPLGGGGESPERGRRGGRRERFHGKGSGSLSIYRNSRSTAERPASSSSSSSSSTTTTITKHRPFCG